MAPKKVTRRNGVVIVNGGKKPNPCRTHCAKSGQRVTVAGIRVGTCSNCPHSAGNG